MSRSPEVRRGGGLPFGQVVSQWMCDPRYTTNLRTLYAILVTYADIGSRDTQKGKPYRQELAQQLGASEKTLDRTVFEGECAGLWWIERRTDPANPLLNDANVYHLRDADFWRGEWTDPLAPGALAADVAKALTEARVKEKRAAGVVAKGGVPKGTKRGKAGGVASPMTPPQTKGGGVTHDATPGVTHDATLASPMTPTVYSPVESPLPEPPDRPSVPTAEDVAGEAAPDGGTDGAAVVEERRGRGGRVAGRGVPAAVRPVEVTPGVALLVAIGASHPEVLMTGDPLRDQGDVVTKMLKAGWRPDLVERIVTRPLPYPITTSMEAVVAGRLRDAAAGPVPDAFPELPRQGQGSVVEHSSTATAARSVAEAVAARPPQWHCRGCEAPVFGAGVLCQACTAAELESGTRAPLCGDCGRDGITRSSGEVLCGPCSGERRQAAAAKAAVEAFLSAPPSSSAAAGSGAARA